jgi:hypothetical protein
MFWEFCAIRQDEWHRRWGKAPPDLTYIRPDEKYTTDPILARKDIPNVFRELDYETRFMHHYVDPRPARDILFGSIAFRLTAKVGPHRDFGGPPRVDQFEEWVQHLHKQREQGKPIFIRIYHTPSLRDYLEALEVIAEHADEIVRQLQASKTLKDAYYVLHGLPRIRNFYAWQCMADLLESKVVNFDENEWCFLGPGPIRAFEMMYLTRYNQNEAMVIARKLRDAQHKALATTQTPWVPPPHIPEFTLKNIEHALCEYMRWVWAHWRMHG